MSAKRAVFLCCGFLMLTSANSANNQTAICNISLFHMPESKAAEGNGNVNNRSLSAWKWIRHTSGRRIPAVIFEAQCETHHCTYPNSKQQENLSSVPIYNSMLVLTQDPKNRTCFTLKFQRVAVGCVCVWKRSSQ